MVYKGSDIIAKEDAVDDVAMDKLAVDFTNKVPEREFSPAQIMHFLVDNRQQTFASPGNRGRAGMDYQDQRGKDRDARGGLLVTGS